MTAETASRTRAVAATPSFASTLASEWTKLTSVRSTYIIVALGILLSMGMSALVAAATGSTWDDWNERDRAEFDPVLFGISGAMFGGILFSVLGVLAFSSEYSSGMIRLTLTVTPRRSRVLFAKAIVVAVITWVAGSVATIGMYLTGQAILDAFDMPTVGLTEGDALRAVGVICVAAPLFPIFGLTLAVLLRSTAGAITTVMALLFAPGILGALLPSWWQENVLAFNPASASDALALGHLSESPMYPEVPLAAVAVVAWLIVFLGAAHFALNRRDA